MERNPSKKGALNTNEEKIAFTNSSLKTVKESFIHRGRRRKRTSLEKLLFVLCILLFLILFAFIVIALVNQNDKGKNRTSRFCYRTNILPASGHDRAYKGARPQHTCTYFATNVTHDTLKNRVSLRYVRYILHMT